MLVFNLSCDFALLCYAFLCYNALFTVNKSSVNERVLQYLTDVHGGVVRAAGELGFGCKSKRFDTVESRSLKLFK